MKHVAMTCVLLGVALLSSGVAFAKDDVDSMRNLYQKSVASDRSITTANAAPATNDTRTRSELNLQNGGVNLHPYSPDLQRYVLHALNNARATLVPTEAANMRKLAWHEPLAVEASELVDACVFQHDTEGYQYGQNLIYGGRILDTQTVDAWIAHWVVDEISASDRVANGYMDLDHASAVLWANTYLVGCASKMCPQGFFTACNYYSPGNWQGERTYLPGAACSQCPSEAPVCDVEESGRLCVAGDAEPQSPGKSAEANAAAAAATHVLATAPEGRKPARKPKRCHT